MILPVQFFQDMEITDHDKHFCVWIFLENVCYGLGHPDFVRMIQRSRVRLIILNRFNNIPPIIDIVRSNLASLFTFFVIDTVMT